MAKTLENFVFPPAAKRFSFNSKYAWEKWLDGQTWCLTQGEDFDVDPKAFKNQVKTQSDHRNLKVNCYQDGANVFIKKLRALDEDEIAAKDARRESRRMALAASKKG